MFKFKMHIKMLVAICFLGQIIELNNNLCIAMSVDLGARVNQIKLHRSLQSALDCNSHNRQKRSIGNLMEQKQTSFGVGESKWSGIVQQLESNGRLNYFGQILIGEEQIPFMVLFDLTSTAFWLPSSECKSFHCLSRQKFIRNKSLSLTEKAEAFNQVDLLKYDLPKLEVTTKLARDRITFAGQIIANQTFSEALKLEGDSLAYLPVDGFLGLGYKDFAQLNKSLAEVDELETIQSPFERLLQMGLLKEPIFSLEIMREVGEFEYSTESGALTLGELAQGYEPHDLTWVPVSHAANYWEFRLSSVTLRHQLPGEHELERACESACPAILHTGSAFIYGHAIDIERLNRALGAQLTVADGGLYRLANCELSLLPDLIFSIGASEFSLEPEDYLLIERVQGQIVACYSALRAIDASQHPFWIFGERFLRRHYVVFDYGQKRVGFAKSRQVTNDGELHLYGRQQQSRRLTI